jgi:hypothetical protein
LENIQAGREQGKEGADAEEVERCGWETHTRETCQSETKVDKNLVSIFEMELQKKGIFPGRQGPLKSTFMFTSALASFYFLS